MAWSGAGTTPSRREDGREYQHFIGGCPKRIDQKGKEITEQSFGGYATGEKKTKAVRRKKHEEEEKSGHLWRISPPWGREKKIDPTPRKVRDDRQKVEEKKNIGPGLRREE